MMDCCLCSPVVSIFRPPRNTICASCYDGAKNILSLTSKLEGVADEISEKTRISSQKGLAQAFNRLKQFQQLGDSVLVRYKFLESLTMAFQEGLHPDVELVPRDGKSIYAHRIVMATKSPIFKNMFEADECKAADVDSIPMSEMSHDELKCFIEFLYSGSISEEQIQLHGHALLLAADKYDIPYLSKICEAHIINSICPSNVLDILELAIVCSSSPLKETAFNSILKHQDEIIFSEKYKEFALRNVLLSVEITQALLKDFKDRSGY